MKPSRSSCRYIAVELDSALQDRDRHQFSDDKLTTFVAPDLNCRFFDAAYRTKLRIEAAPLRSMYQFEIRTL